MISVDLFAQLGITSNYPLHESGIMGRGYLSYCGRFYGGQSHSDHKSSTQLVGLNVRKLHCLLLVKGRICRGISYNKHKVYHLDSPICTGTEYLSKLEPKLLNLLTAWHRPLCLQGDRIAQREQKQQANSRSKQRNYFKMRIFLLRFVVCFSFHVRRIYSSPQFF